MDGYNRFAPVKEGDEIDVKIEALGDKGDGIAKKDGFVLVIPGTKVNDEVRVRITKVLRRVGFAEVISEDEEAEEPSEEKPEVEETTEEEAEEPKEEEESKEEESEKAEATEEEPAPEKEEKKEEGKDSEDFGEDLEEK